MILSGPGTLGLVVKSSLLRLSFKHVKDDARSRQDQCIINNDVQLPLLGSAAFACWYSGFEFLCLLTFFFRCPGVGLITRPEES